MGYTTEFSGELKFNRELKASEILLIQSMAQENPDDHPEWVRTEGDQYSYIKWELTNNLNALQWDGGEKFYNAVEALNMLIKTLWVESPDLRLSGVLNAQGEEIGDLWQIHIGADGLAYQKDLPKPEDLVTCPHCDEQFRLSDAA